MKKYLLSTLILCSVTAGAQFFQGLRSSMYGGITNVNYNPAIADAPFVADVNLIGLGFNMTNNYVGISKDYLLHPGTAKGATGDFQTDFLHERINGKDKSAVIAAQIQGPLSFMCTWGKGANKNKNAFGFSYHINSVTNIDKFDETFVRIAYYGAGYTADSILKYVGNGLNNQSPSAKTLNWADFGLTYSRVIYDQGPHFIKFGGTLKLLMGIAGGYAYVNNLQYNWKNFDTISVFKSEAHYAYSEGLISSKGYPVNDFGSQVKDLFSYKNSTPTVAVDLGMVYEWRPDKDKEAYHYKMDCEDQWRFDKSRYKLALGFSVIDLGAIRFKKGAYSGDFTANITDWRVKDAKFPDGLQSIVDTVQKLFVSTSDGSKFFTMWLPTRFNVFLDYNIAYGFGLNLAGTISPNMAQNRNMVHQASSITLTPKYDHAWFGAYLPVSYDFKGNVSWGATLRMGPLTIGTSDILGLFAKKFVYNADIHMALKITIPYSKIRDHDKDGVSNKLDQCKKDKGSCASHGCPDRDGDGILDKEDRCPDNPGPLDLKGCPDSDGDGIADVDDSCVHEKGLAEFHGCPDRDSDKIMDKLDECPDTPGIPEFNGCPDRDKDGTPDKTDLCPDVPGAKDHFGCPDTDGDGIYDNEDRCINTPGPKENNGCPWPDKDGDGVFDKDDECPTVFGVPENKGCPKLAKKELETLKYAFDNLEFETGKDIIRSHSFPSLSSLASLLVSKPSYGLRIEGHTDNVGTDEKNLILSQKRATAVKNYLVKKGVKANMLEDFGYGEARPIADNDTKEGKQKNRRVEMKITFH